MFACGLLLLRNSCSAGGLSFIAATATMGRNSPHKVEAVLEKESPDVSQVLCKADYVLLQSY